MPTKDFQLSSFDGLELHCRQWAPATKTPVKAKIVFVHGFSEYLDCYDTTFERVASAGFVVNSYDARGHGTTAKSPRDFGQTNERGVMGDLETVIAHVAQDCDAPLVLWGFSMGGAVVLNYMVIGKLREKFSLFISAGPYVAPSPDILGGLNGVLLKLLPVVVMVYPTFTQSVDLKPEQATNDPAKWELYRQQPMRHCRSSAELMNDAVRRGRRLLDPEFIKNIIDRPLLLSFGTSDQICDPEATKQFFQLVKLSDKTLDPREGQPHELMQALEPAPTEYWNTVHNWLNKQLSQLPHP